MTRRAERRITSHLVNPVNHADEHSAPKPGRQRPWPQRRRPRTAGGTRAPPGSEEHVEMVGDSGIEPLTSTV